MLARLRTSRGRIAGHGALPRVLCLSAALLILSQAHASAGGYLAQVMKAAALLSEGNYPEAIRAFRQARELDMNDPLAGAGLACALDAAGDSAAARAELALTLKLDANCRSAQWARALLDLNAGRAEEARRQFEALRSALPTSAAANLAVAIAYARCASGDYAGAQEAIGELGDRDALSPSQRAAAALVAGAAAYGAGKHPLAADLLREALRYLPPVASDGQASRRRAPLLPSMRPARPEPVPLVSAPSIGPNGRTRSGTVRLYLDAFRFPDARYVTFLVDGLGVHTTNAQPFCYDWDTRRVRNGYHKVVIRAQGANGEDLGQTEEVILVQNEGVSFPPPYPAEEYARADERLLHAMAVPPDGMSLHYLLGLSLARAGNPEGAAASLEWVMAQDPDFADARKELQAIYAARNGHRVRKVSSVPTQARKIAITFDDGPHPLYTPPLLDLLERYRARCTMFLVGMQAEAYPDIVREIVEKGHEVANHTYSHPNLTTVNPSTVEMELLKCRSVLRRITGKTVDLFRPPGGHADATIAEICARYGFTTVYWDVFDSWLQKYDTPTVLQRLALDVKPGSIVLLHNGSNKTAGIVEPLLEELTRQGYQFVTVSELLAERTPGASVPTEAPDAPEIRDESHPQNGSGPTSRATPRPGRPAASSRAMPSPRRNRAGEAAG